MSLSQHPGACVAWPGSWHNSLDKQVWGEGGVLDCCWEACVSGHEEMDCVPVCVLMGVRACVCVCVGGEHRIRKGNLFGPNLPFFKSLKVCF